MLQNGARHSSSEKREQILFSLKSINGHIASAYHFPEKYMRKTVWVNKVEEVKKK